MHHLLHHLLRDAAMANPDGVAVVDGPRSLTYAQLDARSSQLAHLLTELDVRRGDRVGLYLDKSLESVVGIYGILKAGAAYVPFDPHAPLARLAYMAADCGLRCVVSAAAKAPSWPGLRERGALIAAVVILDAAAEAAGAAPEGMRVAGSDELDRQQEGAPPVRVIDLDLAYILYTSGSTGDPKGVMLTHRNALAFVEWAAEEFAVSSVDRLSSHAPLHFDLSVFDVFAAARGAAAVVLVPPPALMFPVEAAAFIRDQAITVWYSVPSALTMLTLRGSLQPGDLPALRTLLFAGEVFPTKYLRQLQALLPHVRFTNLYGPTETNVCTWYEVPDLPDDMFDDIPIGRAIPNDDVFVVTDDGRLAAPGEVGELYVRGATVMRGYWGDVERTARSLVPDPFGTAFRDPAYRTGDLVRQDTDGTLWYVGRRDAQIKSRGYRIELGEIETALNAHPSVRECAVVAIPDEMVTNRLRAFVVVDGDLDGRELARFCAERIPRYMVPEQFEVRDELARTSTGKIDRQALLREATTHSRYP